MLILAHKTYINGRKPTDEIILEIYYINRHCTVNI